MSNGSELRMQKRPVKKDIFILALAIITSLLALLSAAFYWTLVDILTEFLFPPFCGFIGLLFLFSFAASVVYIWKHKCLFCFSTVPLSINLITFLLLVLIPFTDLWLKWNFIHYREEREKIVNQVLAGELQPNVEYNSSLIALPSSFKYISCRRNDIVVEDHKDKKYIFFFTYSGILDNYAGFLYTPDGGDPAEYNDLHETASTQIVPYGENCYWVSHW